MTTKDEHLAAILNNPECRTMQLVFADWLQEHGEHERAELLRVHIELARGEPRCTCSTGVDGKHNGCAYSDWIIGRARARELEARLSAWPCDWCKGEPIGACDFGCGTEYPTCAHCGGSGDVLKESKTLNGIRAERPLPLSWLGGYPQGVTLPTLADAVGTWMGSDWQPTPRLRALAATPPWGVSLTWVIPGDREPYWNGVGYCWFDAGRNRPNDFIPDDTGLPTPVFALLVPHLDGNGKVRWREYPTAHAAKVALCVAILEFGRKS